MNEITAVGVDLAKEVIVVCAADASGRPINHGHTPKLMAAELVAPFRMSRGAKNDRNDAQAILCAVRQPNMRFVTVKSIDQQAMLAWHRSRSGYLDERKALLSRTRGLLAEFVRLHAGPRRAPNG
jgi:transposase